MALTAATKDSAVSCLCHKTGVKGSLTNFTSISWATFKTTCDVRNDEISQSMEGKWKEGPFGGYHRLCYKDYTSKSHLERVKAKQRKQVIPIAKSLETGQKEQSSIPKTRSSVQPTDSKNCWICQKEKTESTDRRIKEKLTLCETQKAGERLLRAASARDDQRLVVALTNQDAVAIDLRYHKSCYRCYTNLKQFDLKDQEGDFESQYDTAFKQLSSEFIEPKLFEQFEVLRMAELREMYIEKLHLQGISNRFYRSEKLKARIQKAYGCRVSFWHPRYRSQSELVYCNDVPKGQIVESAVNVGHAESMNIEGDGSTDDNYMYYAAKSIRASLLCYKTTMSWPPYATDVSSNHISLPDSVCNFLTWILTDDCQGLGELSNKCDLDEDEIKHNSVQRLVQSFGQDLLYAVSKGRQKTPKHVALSITVKNLTGNKEVVTLLNRFGHGISYDQVLQIETRLAEEQLRTEVNGVILPKIIQPNVFSTFCWDNIDILEETLSGKGTTHCTNGIIIQRQVAGCDPPPTRVRDTRGPRKRTFQAVSNQVQEYNAGRRIGPEQYTAGIDQRGNIDCCHSATLKDFAWFLSRVLNNQDDCLQPSVPAWRAFNAIAHKSEIPAKSVVGYCQVIDASPTDLSTVYTILKKSVEMASQLGLQDTVVVLDQAIYSKALEVVWKQKEEFKNVVLRMGSFHIICTFLAVLGKRFGESGLQDLLIESGLVGSGSVNGVLQGKHYNRAVRTHKIVMEALLRLNWQSFDDTTKDDEAVNSCKQAVITAVVRVQTELSSSTIQRLHQSAELKELHTKLEEFNTAATNMAKYWLSYIEMVSLLLCFIRSIRDGDWELYLACIRDIIPWMFAYDRVNYSRYLSVYLLDMKSLEEKHPEVLRAFQAGEFVVQRSASPFSQIPVDQTIEQTVNRDTKSKGGIIGFSVNKGAVQRWILTSHERAAITPTCRQMAGLQLPDGDAAKKEMGNRRMALDEKDVQNVLATIKNWMNPFEPTDEVGLYHLASGSAATAQIEKDLLTAHHQGKEAMKSFFSTRLLSNEVPFHDPLKKLKLTNFSSSKLSKVKIAGKDIMIKADRDLFARLLVVAQRRSMDLSDVFQYSLGPLPWSLASVDGSLAKTDKSKLLEVLTKDIPPVEDIPPTSAIIIDGMAILQSLKPIPDTFEELALKVFHLAVPHTSLARRVDFVTDRYPEVSIKNPEREKRAKEGVVKVKISGSGQKCPKQWRKYLSSGENKSELVQFILKEWSQDKYKDLIGNRHIFFAVELKCFRLSVDDDKVLCQEIPSLSSNHEEADTKLLLHAKHAADNGENTIIIKSQDTDVVVLACHFSSQIPARILLLKKVKTRVIYLDVSAMAEKAGPLICNALPGLHAFTGCDSVSCFVGKGKKAPMKQCIINDTDCEAMSMLGRSFEEDDALISHCEKFVCCLYGYPDLSSVNSCRYQMFATKQSQSHCLPPCKDALTQHIKRANYQAAIWRRSLCANPDVPSPENHGWVIQEDLSINWMLLPPAPAALLDLIMCGCTGNCSTGHCTCQRNGMSCTDACLCIEQCDNPHNAREEDDEEEQDEQYDDENDED